MQIEEISPSDKVLSQTAADLIGKIDSGEKQVFLEQLGKQQGKDYFHSLFFTSNTNTGVFFCCMYLGTLRIQIAFENDTDEVSDQIFDLIVAAEKLSKAAKEMIWLRNENIKIRKALQNHFVFEEKSYASIEFIMERESFEYAPLPMTLAHKAYEPEKLDQYLELLDQSMTFVRPAPNYRGNRAAMAEKFSQNSGEDSFRSFWSGEELVGLNLRKGAEIDLMAIAAGHQRKGYGNAILNDAIAQVFANTDKEFAYLYCVDWNEKGQNFYRKFGMRPSAHSFMLTRIINQ